MPSSITSGSCDHECYHFTTHSEELYTVSDFGSNSLVFENKNGNVEIIIPGLGGT